jgi:RHS repeat-associated protein
VELTYPDGTKANYDYFKNGWLENIQNFVIGADTSAILYHPWGAPKSITFLGDTSYVDAFTYDSTTTRLTKIHSHKGSTKFWGQTYEYDLPGNITRNIGLYDNGNPNNSDTAGFYSYDFNYLLHQAKVKSGGTAKKQNFGYNDNGNRLFAVNVDVDSTHYFIKGTTSHTESLDTVSVQAGTDETDSISIIPATIDTVRWDCFCVSYPGANFKIWSSETTYVDVNSGYQSGAFVPLSLNPIFVKARGPNSPWEGVVSGTVSYPNSIAYVYISNKIDHLSTQADSNYQYDNTGRLIEDIAAGKEYVYNPLGQLVTYRKDGNDRIFFEYDYSGHLVKKTVLTGNLCGRPDTCNSGDICTKWSRDSCSVGDPNSGYVAGDANGNGQFNGMDPTFLSNWLQGQVPDTSLHDPRSRADANCSGSVNGVDVTYMVNYFKGGSMVYCCFWDSSYEASTYYIYSGNQIIAEYNNSGALDWNYVYGLGQRLAKYKNSDKWIYHNDHLGNVRAVSNTSGSTVNKADYYPFGEKLYSYGDIGKYAYNGKEYVDDYGFDLYYYGARFMDPATGRFITPDPIKDYLNQYSYVGNNPVNRIDPMGMWMNNPSFSSQTGYDFGGNPFWWMSSDAYSAWYYSDEGSSGMDEHRKEVEKREREKIVRNLIDELKAEAQAMAGKIIGPNKWHIVMSYLDALTASYSEETGFGLLRIVENLSVTDRDGNKLRTLSAIGSKTNILDLDLSLIGGIYSDQFVKSLILHEASHLYHSGGTDDQEYEAKDTQMEYWDRFKPDITHNEVENYWQGIYDAWLDERRQLGTGYNLYDFWPRY